MTGGGVFSATGWPGISKAEPYLCGGGQGNIMEQNNWFNEHVPGDSWGCTVRNESFRWNFIKDVCGNGFLGIVKINRIGRLKITNNFADSCLMVLLITIQKNQNIRKTTRGGESIHCSGHKYEVSDQWRQVDSKINVIVRVHHWWGFVKTPVEIIISILLLHLPSVICRPVPRVEMNTSQKRTGAYHLSTYSYWGQEGCIFK